MKLIDIKNYIDGNWRYFLYRTFPALLSKYVKREFEDRLTEAKDCYINGSCKSCGCKTPQLFMANKGCSKEENPCYKSMIPLWKRLIKTTTKWIGIGKLNTLVK